MSKLKVAPSSQSTGFVSYSKKMRMAFRDTFRSYFDYKKDVISGLEYRPHYALCLLLAAEDAKKLGVKTLKVFELGCAGGSGLVDLQYLTKRVESYTGVSFVIHGFDCGTGLPPSDDLRDCLYLWEDGDYPMDKDELQVSLHSTTQLHIGDVADTLEAACHSSESPVGVIFFDMDYYSSTMSALSTLSLLPPNAFLPRTITYFDDLLFTSDYSGELLAINDFNELSEVRKISRIPHLASFFSLKWENWIYLGEKIFSMHCFDHHLYSVKNIDGDQKKNRLDLS
jgi:hypothetical protein